MTVALDTLCSVEGSKLQKMFSCTKDLKRTRDGQAYYLDRDYDAFNNLVNYLRSNRQVFPQMMYEPQVQLFEQELDFWKLKTTHAPLEEKRIRNKLNKDLVAFFDSEPIKACSDAKKKWQKLGIFQFNEIERFSQKNKKSIMMSNLEHQLNSHIFQDNLMNLVMWKVSVDIL